MDFCKKCKSIMVPVKTGKASSLKCRKCGFSQKKASPGMKIEEKMIKRKGVMMIEKDDVLLPITEAFCPKCDNPKAYYWLQQTRAADEPPTQFFRCVKCRHTWREYK
jgi:transcription factor S